MKNLNEIDVIAVKDKNDVLKASELLEKIGLKVFRSEETKNKFIQEGDDVKNNFLIKDVEGWRIQSHYLGNGISVEECEKKINQLILKNPNSKNDNEFLDNLKKDWKNIKKSISTFEKRLEKFESRLNLLIK